MNLPISWNRLKPSIVFLWLLVLSAGASAQTPTYDEPWRPQFHFTPATNWMNDPNGMLFYEGEYHLFYQFNPFGIKWGHMSWGHAVSPDLVHWAHLPIALIEEEGVMIFSGSAVVDWKNTSGFGTNGRPPLVAIYTGHYTKKPLQNQHIAYSNDRGRTWTKFSGNPVLDIGARDFRDPKVMWHTETGRWIMAVAWPNERKVRFYSSADLKEWTHLSDFGPVGSTVGIWECPDLFPLAIEGAKASRHWVLVVNVGTGAPAGGSGCQYFIGQFDGARFVLDPSYPQGQPEFMPEGRVLADFDGIDYGGWTATGDAFGKGPARGRIGTQQAVEGFRGGGLVNTFARGDQAQGTLTSHMFELTNHYVNFLIGGGNHPGKTCMNLLVDEKVVRSATGDAAERLVPKSWDVREFRGRKARVQIVDQHTGGWGHINVDQIVVADEPARAATHPALWADYGRDFYAAVSWSDVPAQDGRRLWLGWMSNWQYANEVPTVPWRSAMSLPRSLDLRQTADGFRLVQQPVRELQKLRGKHHHLDRSSLLKADEWLAVRQIRSPLLEVILELEMATNDLCELALVTGDSERTVLRAGQGRLSIDRSQSGQTGFHAKFPGTVEGPLSLRQGGVRLHLFVDASSIEVFGNDGELVMTELILPGGGRRELKLSAAHEGTARVRRLDVWELKSAWR